MILIPAYCWTIAMSLLHSLWQGILVAFFVAFVLKSPLKTNRKFKLAFCCLLLVGSLPLLNFCWIGLETGPYSITQETFFSLSNIFDGGDIPTNANAEFQGELSPSTAELSLNTTQLAGVASGDSPERFVKFSSWTFIISATVTAGYLFGLMVMLSRLVLGLRSHSRLNRVGLGTGLQAPQQVLRLAENVAASFGRSFLPKIKIYQGHGSALLVGLLRPVVLINSSLLTGLTPFQLEQVLRHELAHVYRLDPLTQLMQRIAESFAFFNPAVWMISREVSLLRELCCDEIVTCEFSKQEYAATLVECGLLSVQNGNDDLDLNRECVVAATGSSASQLTTRVRMLLGEPLADGQRFESNARLLAISALLTILLFGFVLLKPPFSSHPAGIPSQWTWQSGDLSQVSSSQFLYGGKVIELTDLKPEKLKVLVIADEERCKFGQWHFGDQFKTPVTIMAEYQGTSVSRLFLDINRNHVLEDGEAILRRTSDAKGWIASLDVEVLDGETRLVSPRHIAITKRRRPNELRISTLGYVEGETEFEGKLVRVRRVDRSGNGLPIDDQDELWLDFDGNGKFDPIAERFDFKPVIDIGRKRYLPRSDRLGHHLQLSRNDQRGSIKFVFAANGEASSVVLLEGALRDEEGYFVPIRLSDSPVAVPAGRYCIENLAIELEDASGKHWRMTLIRAKSDGWFSVAPNETVDLKLLNQFSFEGVLSIDNLEAENQLRPSIYTANGLAVTNLSCWNDDEMLFTIGNQKVATFQVNSLADKSLQVEERRSGFS